jgi:hypothetical protein
VARGEHVPSTANVTPSSYLPPRGCEKCGTPLAYDPRKIDLPHTWRFEATCGACGRHHEYFGIRQVVSQYYLLPGKPSRTLIRAARGWFLNFDPAKICGTPEYAAAHPEEEGL